MIANKKKQALSRYRSFVEGADIGKLENPLKDVYGGFILGTKVFIKQTLDFLDDIILEKNETSHRRKLRKTVEPEDVIKAVSNYLTIPADELLNMKGEIRGVAVYFLKVYTDMSNNEIGKLFGGLSYSAVSKIKQRFLNNPSKDRSLNNKIKKMHQCLSNVKG